VRVVWVAPALIRTKQSFTTCYRIVAKNYRLFACTCRFLGYETIFDLLTDSTEAHFTCDKCYRVDANVLNYTVLSLTIPVLICFPPRLRFYSSFISTGGKYSGFSNPLVGGQGCFFIPAGRN
jgi:hypothetical protein